jgi:HAE1 family hydrophobic/amphiphilic exporter-1
LPARYEAERQESFVHPLTILSGLPSAGVGALLTLLLFGKELNLSGFVGLSCWSVS